LNVSLCTISFRHELMSFQDLVRFASHAGFDGIELWGVHAMSLLRNAPMETARIIRDLERFGVKITMLSDYIDIFADEHAYADQKKKWQKLLSMARLFQTGNVRIFAGNKASLRTGEEEWRLCVRRLRELAELAADSGKNVLIETHPNTLADSLESTLRLLHEVNHSHLRVNFDFLHVWESGCDPLVGYRALEPWIDNFHAKNITDRSRLHVFEPLNVYSPSGTRQGMTPLADGAVNYAEIIETLIRGEVAKPISIEWFGNEPYRIVKAELAWLRSLETASRCASHATVY